jgi:hypothetical protein
MKSCILYIFLCSQMLLTGQGRIRPYEKMVLQGTQPVWYETMFDSLLIHEESDGYSSVSSTSHIEPIIFEEYLFTIHGILNTNKGFHGGAIIQKRNINSGKLEWRVLYDLDSQPYPEIPFKMYLSEGKYLHVHGYRNRIDAKPEFFPFLYFPTDSCLLTYRKIDVETGKVLEFYTPEENDENAVLTIASLNPHSIFSDLLFTKHPDEFIYWERRSIWNETIHFQKVNKYGLALSGIDSVKLSTPINSSINIEQLNADTIVHIGFNNVDQKINLFYYNNQFQLLDSLELKNFPGKFRIYTYAKIVNNQFVVIRTFNQQIDSYRYLDAIYDMKGNLLDYFELTSFGFITYWSNFDPLRQKILVMSSLLHNNPLQYIATLYETDGIGGLQSIHEFIPEDSLKTIGGLYLYPVQNDKMLIYFDEGEIYINEFGQPRYDNYANAQSLMLFNSIDLGLNPVSIKESFGNGATIKIYPNPGQDYVMFTSEKPVSGTLTVYNITGGVVYKEILNQTDSKSIDTALLSPGFYFLVFSGQENGENISIKWIKEK